MEEVSIIYGTTQLRSDFHAPVVLLTMNFVSWVFTRYSQLSQHAEMILQEITFAEYSEGKLRYLVHNTTPEKQEGSVYHQAV